MERRASEMKTKKNRALSVVLIFLGIVMLFPIYILFMVSFRNEHTIFQASMITANPSLESIQTALTIDFIRALGNSFLIAISVTLIALVLHAMCGYAFARMKFAGKKVMFTIVISTLMIPVSSILVPLFMICKQMGITNTYAGILLPALFNAYGIIFISSVLPELSGRTGRSCKVGWLFYLQNVFYNYISFI